MLRDRLATSLLLALGAVLLFGCSSSGNEQDASGADAGTSDRGSVSRDALAADATEADLGTADSGLNPDASEGDATELDLGTPDATGADASPTDGAIGGGECAPSAILDLDMLGTRSGNALTLLGSTAGTSSVGTLPGPSCLPEIGHAVVHRYTPRVSGALTVTLNDPATLFDTVAWALTTCSTTATELGCNDNGDAPPRPSASTFAIRDAVAGTPIEIVVAGFRTPAGVAASGAYRLTVREVNIALAGQTCDPLGIADLCQLQTTCVENAATPGVGRCTAPCDFIGATICPLGTSCNGRAGTPDTSCVADRALGAVCDAALFLPNDACAAPNICITVGTATVARCVAPTYHETSFVNPVFIDACALGTPVGALSDLDDGHSGAIALPGAFLFYGASYTQLWADTNGYAVLGTDAPADATFGPPSIGDGPAVAPFWTDLVLDRGQICSYATGTRFVVEWFNAYRSRHPGPANNPMRLTFELILDRSNQTIDFIYQTLTPTSGVDEPFASGLDAHQGVQNATGGEWTIHSGRVSRTVGLRFSP